MADNTIILTNDYYTDVSPTNYYYNLHAQLAADRIIRKPEIAIPVRPVYVSDLIDKDNCKIIFGRYRTKDNTSANLINKTRSGIVRGYNPKTNLLKIQSKKNDPSLKKFDTKIRYVEPEISIIDLSVPDRGKGSPCELTTVCRDKPECITKLNKRIEEYYENRKKFFNQSLVKTVKGAGRRSRRNSRQQLRKSMRGGRR
jgi:hypothetical protein